MRTTLPIGDSTTVGGITITAIALDRIDDQIILDISDTAPDERLQRRFEEFSEFLVRYPETLPAFFEQILEQAKTKRRTSALTAVCRVRSAHRKTAGRYTSPLRNVAGTYLARLVLLQQPRMRTVLVAEPAWDDASDEQLKKLLRKLPVQCRLSRRH